MSAVASIDAAAAGRLPGWAKVRSDRRAHIGRVADLMDAWAAELELDAAERARWRAAAWLHDALRDGDPEALRREVQPDCRDLPGLLLHGPAAAARLREEGARDDGLIRAVAYHTTGHPELDRMGRMLFLADFLEPGRTFEPVLRASLRARMPGSADALLREVVALRIAHILSSGRPVRPESLAFWNAMVKT